MGLAALAEDLDGGETPTSDAAGPASFAPMSPQLRAKQLGLQQEAAGAAVLRGSKDAKDRVVPPDEVSLLGSVGTVVAVSAAKAAAVASGTGAGAAPCNSSTSGVRGPAQQSVARPSGEYGGAAPHALRHQLDGENDLRWVAPMVITERTLHDTCCFCLHSTQRHMRLCLHPNQAVGSLLSHLCCRPTMSTGVADSSATMCNLDSCASGPNHRGLASAAAGGECLHLLRAVRNLVGY